MSVLRGLFERRSDAYPPVSSPFQGQSDGKWEQGMVFHPWGSSSSATPQQAMRLSAVYGCLRLLSESIATLPVDCFRRRGERRIPMDTPPWLRFDSLSEPYSAIDYLSQIMLSLLTDGNAYVATARDAMGVPITLAVLDPCEVTLRQDRRGGPITYTVKGQDYDWLDILHIRGMTLPGHVEGVSPLTYAREVADLGLSAQRFGASFFENGALPGAVVEAPGAFKQESAERFMATWNARHGGVGNAQRVGFLTNGATLSKVSIAPNDAQFIESRAFSVSDICRFFGVPPHLVADASNSTSWGSGLAEQNTAFGQFSLQPWVTRIDTAHTRLLSSAGLRGAFFKLNIDAQLRATIEARYQAYAIGLENKFITPNEVRAWEDLPPLAGGDVPIQGATRPLPGADVPPGIAPPVKPPVVSAPGGAK